MAKSKYRRFSRPTSTATHKRRSKNQVLPELRNSFYVIIMTYLLRKTKSSSGILFKNSPGHSPAHSLQSFSRSIRMHSSTSADTIIGFSLNSDRTINLSNGFGRYVSTNPNPFKQRFRHFRIVLYLSFFILSGSRSSSVTSRTTC